MKNSTALELAYASYDRFEDKKDITNLLSALLSTESSFTKRDDEGNETVGFKDGIFDAIANIMRTEFVADRRCSSEIRELCVELMKKMKY